MSIITEAENCTICAPYPSPRNQFWLRKNPWFETDVLPFLKEKIKQSLSA